MEIYTGTKSVVLSLDPRGVILNGGIDVASRQNNYGYQIKSQNNNLDFFDLTLAINNLNNRQCRKNFFFARRLRKL